MAVSQGRRVARAMLGPGLGLIASLFLLGSCSFAYRVDVVPSDASIRAGGAELRSGTVFRSNSRAILVEADRKGYVAYRAEHRHRSLVGLEVVGISLRPESYEIAIALVKGPAELSIDGQSRGPVPFKGSLDFGSHELRFDTKDGPGLAFRLDVEGPSSYLFRMQPGLDPGIRPLGILPCGPAPKQVTFSPEGDRLFIPLLSGKGFDIIDLATRQRTKVEVPDYGKATGFVEGLFIEAKSRFLVSQMTRDALHEYRLSPGGGLELLRSFPTFGTWSKVIAYEPLADILAVSNWVSGDVTILDYASGVLEKRLSALGTPRGLLFSPDGSSLTVADYDQGRLFRFDTATWKKMALIERRGGALRHIVGTKAGDRLYVSDMGRDEVLKVSAADFKVERVFKTESNPNTIDLDVGEKLLAVSCRGPNNPESYLLRSLVPGAVLIFDTEKGTLLARIEGGAQPTGLDISPDGRLLAFTDFQDAAVELYDISALSGRLSAPSAGAP